MQQERDRRAEDRAGSSTGVIWRAECNDEHRDCQRRQRRDPRDDDEANTLRGDVSIVARERPAAVHDEREEVTEHERQGERHPVIRAKTQSQRGVDRDVERGSRGPS